MGRYYSLDLRLRVASFVEAGHSRRAAARPLGSATVVRSSWRSGRRGLDPPLRTAKAARPEAAGSCPMRAFLIQAVEAEPAITMPELAARLLGGARSVGGPGDALAPPLPFAASHIKKSLMAAECARADVRDERRVWRRQRQPRMRQEPHRLVFFDETYVNTKMTRLRGRCRKGQRLRT